MNVSVQLPDSLATQAREFAQREHISMDDLVASALTAQLDHTPHRPTIAERAARVDWEKGATSKLISLSASVSHD